MQGFLRAARNSGAHLCCGCRLIVQNAESSCFLSNLAKPLRGLSTAFQQVLWKTRMVNWDFAVAFLSWVHFRAILEPKNEFESGPNVIHGADLDVHQAGGKANVSDNILREIG